MSEQGKRIVQKERGRERERGRGREGGMTKENFLYFEGRMMNIKSIRDYLSSCCRKFVLARDHDKFHFLPFFQKHTRHDCWGRP